jgi:hypothetical protein
MAGFFLTHPGGNVFRDLLFEMELHLVIELLNGMFAKKKCSESQPQSLNPEHKRRAPKLFP